MSDDYYVLIGQTPVPVECDPCTEEGKENLLRWARDFGASDRRVAETFVVHDLCRVSTVFLGLDHNFARFFGRDHLPHLFETMSFWWPFGSDLHQERCSTWLDAEEQHRRVVADCSRPWTLLRALWTIAWAIARGYLRGALSQFPLHHDHDE